MISFNRKYFNCKLLSNSYKFTCIQLHKQIRFLISNDLTGLGQQRKRNSSKNFMGSFSILLTHFKWLLK